MLVGYARVSTSQQETDLQLDALRAAGVSLIFEEKASSVGQRPQLRRALAALRPGDVLVVWKIDRLARSLVDLLQLLQSLADRGCGLKSLTEPIDTSTPMGVFVLQILGAVAQLERSMIRVRVTAGIHASIARGTRWGRRHRLSEHERREVQALVRAGVPIASIAHAYGISRALVYAYMSHPRYE